MSTLDKPVVGAPVYTTDNPVVDVIAEQDVNLSKYINRTSYDLDTCKNELAKCKEVTCSGKHTIILVVSAICIFLMLIFAWQSSGNDVMSTVVFVIIISGIISWIGAATYFGCTKNWHKYGNQDMYIITRR